MNSNKKEFGEITLLESEVEQKLLSICQAGITTYEKRKLFRLTGKLETLHLHSPVRRLRNSSYQYGVDDLACRLSQLPELLTRLQQSGLKHIILLPESIRTDSYLLTHLYLARHGILARYSYPLRFDRSEELPLPERFEQETLNSHGLDYHIFHNILLNQNSSSINCNSETTGNLLKYTLPLSELSAVELRELKHINNSYFEIYHELE